MNVVLGKFGLAVAVSCACLCQEGYIPSVPYPTRQEESQAADLAESRIIPDAASRRYMARFELDGGVFFGITFNGVEEDERTRHLRRVLAKHWSELLPESYVEREGDRLFGNVDVVEHGNTLAVMFVDLHTNIQNGSSGQSLTPGILLVTGDQHEVVRRVGGFASFF